MNVVRFRADARPECLSACQAPPADGLVWLDLERSETEWSTETCAWTDIEWHDRHVVDSLNPHHPPFYDSTAAYEMLILRSWDRASPPEAPQTRPIAFFLSGAAVVTVRPPGDPVFDRLRKRLCDGPRRSPASPAELLHLLMNQVVDGLLTMRDPLGSCMEEWESRLLDLDDAFEDWRRLMRLRSRLRRLEMENEGMRDALAQWRDQTAVALDDGLRVRFNDLDEHLRRILNDAQGLQHDIDGLIQIHFAAAAQRTNQVVQVLTVVAAIFLPLNFIAGIFGMNFAAMPLIRYPLGLWAVVAFMAIMAVASFLWFRRRGWV
jgi:magnesium/cobalt transport protein CorA